MPTALSRLPRAARAYLRARENRDALIRAASAEGASLRAIAAAVGISHVHVKRLLRGG